MDVDRTSLSDRAQDLRTRPQQQLDRPEQPADAAAPVAPEHGGPLASSRTENQAEAEPDPDAEARRQQAYETVARFLHLPGGTELDIRVDVEEEQVTFLIRDRQTGELIRSVPERESGALVDKLREFTGTFVDKAY